MICIIVIWWNIHTKLVEMYKRTSQQALLMMIVVMVMIMMVRNLQTFPAFKLTAQCDFYLPLSPIVYTSSKCKLFTDA